MQLISPSIDMAEAFVTAARDYCAHGERCYQRELEERGLDLNRDFDFGEYIRAVERDAEGDILEADRVPQSTFWLVDDSRTVIFGTSRLRHYLTAENEIVGGHIGYDVAPSQRRKGYGTVLLKMTLAKARTLGLTRVLITCASDNVGSQKIILHNGGVLENELYSDEDGKMVKRYWIEL